MPREKITESVVKYLKPATNGKQFDRWDSLLPGFGVRISGKGAKTWVVMTRVLNNGEWKLVRISLGRYPAVSLAHARRRAKEVQIAAQEGKDPRRTNVTTKQRLVADSLKTFGKLREHFIERHCEVNLKPGPLKEYKRTLRSELFSEWEEKPISQIKRKDIIMLLDSIVAEGTPIKANRVFDYMRSMFNWAASRDLIEYPPTDRVCNPAAEVQRDRVLSTNEIKVLWEALPAARDFEPLFKILLLTGQRRSEVAGMEWNELKDLDRLEPMWELPKERTKMNRPHKVPLSSMAVEIVRSIPRRSSRFVFTTSGLTPMSGFGRAKRRVDARIKEILKEKKLQNVFDVEWRLHDLRRTAATVMAELGVSRDVVELILNHMSGSRGGVCGVYNRSELMDKRREALDALAHHIQENCIEQMRLDETANSKLQTSQRTVGARVGYSETRLN